MPFSKRFIFSSLRLILPDGEKLKKAEQFGLYPIVSQKFTGAKSQLWKLVPQFIFSENIFYIRSKAFKNAVLVVLSSTEGDAVMLGTDEAVKKGKRNEEVKSYEWKSMQFEVVPMNKMFVFLV